MPRKRSCTFHLVCQTHWDREWRFAFEQTRFSLIRMMDALLDVMDNDPDYRHYHLDGQTILLEDYLAIRPENRERLRKHIRNGRILVGPWYTLPDENQIAGESIARNLLIGDRLGREMGGVMKVGFTPTSWGQVSQIPQIFRGFGLDTILFHRGVPSHKVKLEYLWEGPDGSRIMGIRPSSGGRFNAWLGLSLAVLFGKEGRDEPAAILSAAKRYAERSYRLGEDASIEDVYWSLPNHHGFCPEHVLPSIRRLKSALSAETSSRHLLLGLGHDGSGPSPDETRILREINKQAEADRVIFSSLPRYVAQVRKNARNLQVLRGEMRSPQKLDKGGMLLPGTLSSRMYLKQMNRRCEFLLTRWTEPVCTFAWLLGAQYPASYLRTAWSLLLANQTHDGISGTGVDQVHRDMVSRFEQVGIMAKNALVSALGRLVDRIDTAALDAGDVPLFVFNPSTYPRSEVVSLTADLPPGTADRLAVRDLDGKPCPFQTVSTEESRPTIDYFPEGLALGLESTRTTLHVLAPPTPGLGWRLLRLTTSKASGVAQPTDLRASARQRTMENRFLKVNIRANGTVRLTDKETGRTFDDLHTLEDSGETGDAYERHPPATDTVITTRTARPRIVLEEEGPVRASFRVRYRLALPRGLNAERTARRGTQKTCTMTSRFVLRANARRLDIETLVDNRVDDHRLRVLFPTGIETSYSWAEVPFDVVRRPVRLPDTRGWVEPASPTQPQFNFVDVTDGKSGLCLINEGLPEYEVEDSPRRTIALTLLRCSTFNSHPSRLNDPSQTGSQCHGIHRFRYAIYPHRGGWNRGAVFKQAYEHSLPLKTVVQPRRTGTARARKNALPPETRFARIRPANLVLSALKKCEDRNTVILRVFNPTATGIRAKASFYRSAKRAWHVTLNENRTRELAVSREGNVSFRVASKKIVTLEMSFR